MATMEVKLVAEKVDSQMWMTEEAAADAATNQALADVIKRQLEAQAEKFIATSVLAAKAVCIEHGSVE